MSLILLFSIFYIFEKFALKEIVLTKHVIFSKKKKKKIQVTFIPESFRDYLII